jgi:hypothetical protein
MEFLLYAFFVVLKSARLGLRVLLLTNGLGFVFGSDFLIPLFPVPHTKTSLRLFFDKRVLQLSLRAAKKMINKKHQRLIKGLFPQWFLAFWKFSRRFWTLLCIRSTVCGENDGFKSSKISLKLR